MSACVILDTCDRLPAVQPSFFVFPSLCAFLSWGHPRAHPSFFDVATVRLVPHLSASYATQRDVRRPHPSGDDSIGRRVPPRSRPACEGGEPRLATCSPRSQEPPAQGDHVRGSGGVRQDGGQTRARHHPHGFSWVRRWITEASARHPRFAEILLFRAKIVVLSSGNPRPFRRCEPSSCSTFHRAR